MLLVRRVRWQQDLIPARLGVGSWTYDPATNSVAADQAPDSPSRRLDHVLPLTGHGPQEWVNETRAVHSPEWSVTSWGQTYTYTDFSDHYPVFASPS
ncbi:hypothetical protein [Saccharopolyspora sp. NPDC002376]